LPSATAEARSFDRLNRQAARTWGRLSNGLEEVPLILIELSIKMLPHRNKVFNGRHDIYIRAEVARTSAGRHC
jgi:hypothetical protein